MIDHATQPVHAAKHGTTLVVADGQLAQSLSHAGLAPVAIDSYLEALGEMSRGPIDLLIGRLGPLTGSMESTTAALRALSPDARMLLIVDAAQEPQAMRAVRLGFDDYIITPFDHVQLMQAIEKHMPRTASHTPSQPVTRAAAPTHSPAPTPTRAPSAPANGKAHLGDVDLLDQLLQQHTSIKDLALELMRQRLGEPGLQWSEHPPQDTANVAPIHYAAQPLGYLHSPHHTPAQLANYAAWLSRWLALDQHVASLNDMALRDELTGVWNRRYFTRTLDTLLRRAKAERFRVTLMLFDIDDFKVYNDRFGHPAGDDILREAARLMASVVRKHDVVARIGGDEFAVIFWDAEPKRTENSEHPDSVRNAAKRFQKAICEHRFPKLGEQAPGTLTISGGLASYPWDGATPQELIDVADRAAMESKQKGKNSVKFGPGALKMCEIGDAQIQAERQSPNE